MYAFHPTARTFYRLRRVLIEVLAVDRQEIRPSTSLEELIPAHKRRAVWKELRRRGLALPSLRLPATVSGLAVTGVLLAAALAFFALKALLAVPAILRLGLTTWLVTRPFAVHIRSGPVTVRDAVLYLTPLKENRDYPWSHEEISTKVRLIVSAALDIPLKDVKPESRFIGDLGC